LAEFDQRVVIGRGLHQATRRGGIAGQGHHLGHVLDVGVQGGRCGAAFIAVLAITSIAAAATGHGNR
jgi:hypothetical protein